MRRILLSLLALHALAAAPAHAQSAATSPPAGSRILIRTTEGKLIDAKLVEARSDSIQLRKGKRLTTVPTAAVQDVWTWERNAIGGLKVGAAFGAVLGAIRGWTLPTDCLDCDDARGSAGVIVRSTLISAGMFGLSGLINGHFDGKWNAHPGLGGSRTTATGPPVPPWALAVTLGRTRNLDAERTITSFALAGYSNTSPGFAAGFELGILEFPRRETYGYQYYAVVDTAGTLVPSGSVAWEVESAWTYGTLFLARTRDTSGSIRGQLLFGPALYVRRDAGTTAYRDSLGAVTRTIRDGDADTRFGLMTGLGASFGVGALRPLLRARGHWLLSGPEKVAITLEAGLDFH